MNPEGNIITPGPGVRLSPDQATTEGYLHGEDSANRQKHEHAHDQQAALLGPAYLPTYTVCALLGWGYESTHPGAPPNVKKEGDNGHDWNPLEIWAQGAETPDASGDRSPWSPILWGFSPIR